MLVALMLAWSAALHAQADDAPSTSPAPKETAPGPSVPEPTQEAPTQDDDEADPAEDEPIVVATLLFTSDAPCDLVVGGIPRGVVEPGQPPLEIEVLSLSATGSCTAVEFIRGRWTEALVLELDESREIAIPMLEAIEDRIKEERRDFVFRDIERGLMWSRYDNIKDISWSGAASYCEALDLGKLDDWQLPTIEELKTLEAMWSIQPMKMAIQIRPTACCFWSTTEGSDNTVWQRDFRFRKAFETNRNLSFGLRALCRRDMGPEELAEAKLSADPKERKRRLKARRERQDEKKRRKAARAAKEEGSPNVTSVPQEDKP